MKRGDLIKPKRNPTVFALVLNTACMEWSVNRIKVLVIGETKPEMCDPRLWEVVNESR